MNFYDNVTRGLKELRKLTRSLRDSVDSKAIIPYKVYSALLSQAGTSAPTATVLENTIGTIVWTRDSAGRYKGTLEGAFTQNKTSVLLGPNTTGAVDLTTGYQYDTDEDNIYVDSYNIPDGEYQDALHLTTIEIRVYQNAIANQALPSVTGKEGKVLGVSAGNLAWVNQQGSSVVYKKYVALLTQSGTDAPIATILENTIGAIVWTRGSLGDYIGTLAGAFPQNKTFIPGFGGIGASVPLFNSVPADQFYNMYAAQDTNRIVVQFYDSSGDQIEWSTTGFAAVPIEIRVYP